MADEERIEEDCEFMLSTDPDAPDGVVTLSGCWRGDAVGRIEGRLLKLAWRAVSESRKNSILAAIPCCVSPGSGKKGSYGQHEPEGTKDCSSAGRRLTRGFRSSCAI